VTVPSALRSGDIVRIRGERWRVLRVMCHGDTALVDVASCGARSRSTRSQFLLPFELVEREAPRLSPRIVRPACWRRFARQVLAAATPDWTSLRAPLRANIAIVPFQLEPAMALVRGAACRLLIADAVGLGKTIQAGLILAEILERQPDAHALVVCPAALRTQWIDELRTRFHVTAAALDAAAVARLGAGLPAEINPWFLSPVAVTSIDYIKRPEVLRSLETLVWDLVVFDEAHNLAGRSNRAEATALLGSRARAVVMLTATPHSGDQMQFDRLCSIGNLNNRYPLMLFRRTRADAGFNSTRRSSLIHVRPSEPEAAMHGALMDYATRVWASSSSSGARLAMSVLVRRGCSSAGSLVRSIERRIALLSSAAPASLDIQPGLPYADPEIEDEEPATVLSVPGMRDGSDEIAHLARILHHARQASSAESKLRSLRRLLAKTREPAIVFTEYRDTLQRVADELRDVEAVQLHGGLTARERAAALRCFTEGTVRLLLATDAASEGLNLHHRCRLVVNLELPWTPLRLEQRAGRVDRIGQRRRVHAIHFVAAETCESRILERLVRRIARIRAAFPAELPAEDYVAESVFTGREVELNNAAPMALDAPHRNVLRQEAREEASRITTARALLLQHGHEYTDGTAIATLVRRRDTAPAGRFWVSRILLTSELDEAVFELLLPVASDLPATPVRSRNDVRALVCAPLHHIDEIVRKAAHENARTIARNLTLPLDLQTHRERDIIASIRDRGARLSAGLLQGGLFDRRNERAAASPGRHRATRARAVG
jgi:superfamily II DNA or RNA helicase